MNILIWLLVGGLVGWIANMLLRTEAEQGFLLNIALGVVGALIGGWLITPLLGAPESGVPGAPAPSDSLGSPLSIFIALAGAVFLLALVNVLRRAGSR